MLGYVKCDERELLVKHYRLYGAVYCGLCHSIRANGVRVLLPFLSYDFVFLALLRMLVLSEKPELEKDFCFLHPFRSQKQRVKNNRALTYSVFASLVLTGEKMRDDSLDSDTSFSKRFLCRCYLPLILHAKRKMIRKDPQLQALDGRICELLSQDRMAEQRGADLDRMCSGFASCLSDLFSFGTEETAHRFLAGIGDKIGRFLYTLDALDDMERDLETRAFNPLIREGRLPDREELRRIDLVLSFYIDEIKKILDLIEGDPSLGALCENIVCRGLSGAAQKIILPKVGEKI